MPWQPVLTFRGILEHPSHLYAGILPSKTYLNERTLELVTGKLAASLKTVAADLGVTILLRPFPYADNGDDQLPGQAVSPNIVRRLKRQASVSADIIDFANGSFKVKGTRPDLNAFKVGGLGHFLIDAMVDAIISLMPNVSHAGCE